MANSTLSEKFRYYGFNLIDRFRSNTVKSHLHELRAFYGGSNLHGENINRNRLYAFLHQAVNTTKYYKNFQGFTKLGDFPVLTKNMISENYDDFFSNKYNKQQLIPVTTSGSYGTPFTFYLTKNKKARQQAEVIFFGEWAGYRIGKKHAYIRVTKVKNKWKLFLQNEYLIDPTHINEQWLVDQRRLLQENKIKFVIGYPSSMYAIAEYCRSRGDSKNDYMLETFISTAEPISDEMRSRISDVFGCAVYSRYSTEEFGVLAMECIEEANHHLNTASYYFEILDPDRDSPVSDGQVGRIVVTDIFSHAFPLIRYDTGDLGIMQERCSCGNRGPILTSIDGRQVETVYASNGERVSPFSINGALRDVYGITQFQFNQKNKRNYELSLVISDLYSNNPESIISERLKNILGEDAEISIRYVSSISAFRSGKRPYILSDYMKNKKE